MPESELQPKLAVKELDLDSVTQNTESLTHTTMHSMDATPKKTSFWKKYKKILLTVGGVFVFLILIGLGLGLYTLSIGKQLQAQAQEATTHGRAALDQFKAQNLPGAESELKTVQKTALDMNNTYKKLAFYNYVPVARGYYQDGQHALNASLSGLEAGIKAISTITPYADVLGFSGEGTFEGGTAENRVKLILQTLEKVTPELDALSQELEKANTELAAINENHYPEKIGDKEVRANILQAKDLLANASKLLEDYRPIIEKLPEIAGATGERKKYLVLFQNDNELRPTGGFLTAYAVIFMENGVVTPEKSDDIYELDKKFNGRIPIPEALGRYLTTEKYWNIRDMNTSPDFKISMEQFFEHYKTLKGEPTDIDGIIAVDTQVLRDLVKIVGPIDIPGYGTFSADNDPRCDCPQIIYALSEIITKPTPYVRQDRKGILAPLMQAILQRIYASPKTFMADLFQIVITSVDGRHLQAYFFNDDFQQAAEKINAAGRMEPTDQDQDFFAVVNANLGGAKSNLFITYDVKQVVEGPENGQITKTVEITYKNPRHGDNCNLEAGLLCLNSTLRDWTRIYLPAGSKLTDAQGFTQQAKEYDEAGFHVIDGFFILEPKSQAKLKLTYTVPYDDSKNYNLKIWKQGGVDPIPNLIEVNGGQEEITLDTDTLYTTDF